MRLTPLNAVSPIDGRYHLKTKSLSNYFSESGLIKYRIQVEVEYFIRLVKILNKDSILNDFPINKFKDLRNLYINFHDKYAIRVKEIENITNHDVKAVEYFLKEEFEKLNLNQYKEFIHFGLTSQDINNTAVPLSIKHACEEIIFIEIKEIIKKLESLSIKWSNIPMLARTHGQPASPTKLGKEIKVFHERLQKQYIDLQPDIIKNKYFTAKFGGATGNFNAHHVAFPEKDWRKFGNEFIESLGLLRQQTTTQIEHYDNLSSLMDNFKRINTILIDLSRDIWTYISMDYFKQSIQKNEVGSSAMPHKVNPIDFENAEGNLGIANSIYEFLSAKLPISRLQRDLTDSTVLRNIGVPLSHNLIAFSSLKKGLNKLVLNNEKIEYDLQNNWAVCAEAIQTILRREGYKNPYESLKKLTRKNSNISEKEIAEFINELKVSKKIKEELLRITPYNYTGI